MDRQRDQAAHRGDQAAGDGKERLARVLQALGTNERAVIGRVA